MSDLMNHKRQLLHELTGLNRPGFVGGSRTCEGWRAWQHLGSTALS